MERLNEAGPLDNTSSKRPIHHHGASGDFAASPPPASVYRSLAHSPLETVFRAGNAGDIPRL